MHQKKFSFYCGRFVTKDKTLSRLKESLYLLLICHLDSWVSVEDNSIQVTTDKNALTLTDAMVAKTSIVRSLVAKFVG